MSRLLKCKKCRCEVEKGKFLYYDSYFAICHSCASDGKPLYLLRDSKPIMPGCPIYSIWTGESFKQVDYVGKEYICSVIGCGEIASTKCCSECSLEFCNEHSELYLKMVDTHDICGLCGWYYHNDMMFCLDCNLMCCSAHSDHDKNHGICGCCGNTYEELDEDCNDEVVPCSGCFELVCNRCQCPCLTTHDAERLLILCKVNQRMGLFPLVVQEIIEGYVRELHG